MAITSIFKWRTIFPIHTSYGRESLPWRRQRLPHLLPFLLLLHHIPLCNSLQLPNFVLPPPPHLLSLPRRRLRSIFSPMSASLNTDATPPPPASKTVRVVIKGRVQGVFFRDWTVENAKELGLKGWVRNRRDGSVEALFSGSPQKVDDMEQRCRRGPPDAMVTALQVFPSTDDDPGTLFERKPTV
ncbi:hypothetical protein ACJIZ3_024283 [Penstemon smallii]|uniref:Acylphosphatase n=1 Tax=Penstemon smallii TaxID=265156 RepID=A0ABD3TTT2_9LAMI